MKKWFAILLALSMVASLFAAALAEDVTIGDAPIEAAAAEDEVAELPDVTGSWYGQLLGMKVTLELNAGGGYTLLVEGVEGTRTGVWTQDASGVICDKAQDRELRLAYEEESLSLSTTLEGVPVALTREEPEVYRPAEEKGEDTARQRDFNGRWTCAMVGLLGMYVDPVAESGVSPVDMVIDGDTVSVSTSGDGEYSDAVGTYNAGIITVNLGGGQDTTCTLHALTDGNLRMDVTSASGIISYYMVPGTEPPQSVEDEDEDEDENEDEVETPAAQPAEEPAPAEAAPETPAVSYGPGYDFAYVDQEDSYAQYYLFDMDEGTVVYFSTSSAGVMDATLTGDMESGITIDYSGAFQEYFRLKTPGDTSAAVIDDGNGFETDYVAADVAEVEALMNQTR